jgi:hypothetical protein
MARAGYKPVIEYCGGALPDASGLVHCTAQRSTSQRSILLLACNVNAPHLLLLCAGTELGGGYFAGSLLQPQSPSTFSTPTIGHCPVIMRPLEQPEGAVALSPHGDVAGGWLGACQLAS